MDSNTSYRQYLQYHANNHPSDTKRREAQALLNVVGDDRRLDGNFLTGTGTNIRGEVTGEQLSNGFTASAINNTVNPWWSSSYDEFRKLNPTPQPPNQQWANTGGGGTYRPNDDTRILAELNQQLGRYDSMFGNVDIAERNRMASILNDYNRGKGELDKGWGDAQEDHDTATRQRLANRQRSRDVIDDDFRNQSNAYDRFFARHGAGSSSAAQYNVPTQLGRARLFQPLIL